MPLPHATATVCMLVRMLFRRGLLVAGLVFVGVGCARGQRLPGGVHPEHYSISITPDLKAARFDGHESIDVVLENATDKITLNSAEIAFGTVKEYKAKGTIVPATPRHRNDPAATRLDSRQFDKSPQVAIVTLDAAKEQTTLSFAHPLEAGSVTLEIAYTGVLNDKLRGFYLSKTKTRNYGVTQFEATDARRAFPSFDEPALKATFDVTLVIDAGDTAISNMQIVGDTGTHSRKTYGCVRDHAEDVDLPAGVAGRRFPVH